MQIKTIDNLDVRGKFVLLRDEFNVQIVGGTITDAFRIEQSMPTIRKLQAGGARVAICAHLGRPAGMPNIKYSLAPVAEYLGVPLVSDCLDKDFMATMHDGDVVLLENLRFHPGEEANDESFARELATGFDIFVNDAFGVSHRAHASTVGVAKFLPAYAGELLASEIKTLSNLLENPTRPLVGIIGGAKIKSKIPIIRALCKLCDKIICGGGIGTSMHEMGGMKNLAVDADNLEKFDADTVAQTMEIMREYSDKIILPIDKGVGPEWAADAPRIDKKMADILPGDVPMDEGPESVARYERIIDGAKTVVWNGSLGMAEWPPVWSRGTYAIARHIATRTRAGELTSIIGGGDTAANLEAIGLKDDITYISTGGGAFLEFIEGRQLPGIKILEK